MICTSVVVFSLAAAPAENQRTLSMSPSRGLFFVFLAAGGSDAKGGRAADTDGGRCALAEHANSVRNLRPYEGGVERVTRYLRGGWP